MTTTTTEKKVVSFEYDEALDLLNRAVAEKGPDFVYNMADDDLGTCEYFDYASGAPSCIVGHAFAYKGLTAADLGVANESYIMSLSSEDPLLDYPIQVDADDKTLNLLARAQDMQDIGTPWGDALAAAIYTAETGEYWSDDEYEERLQDQEEQD